MIDDVLVQLSCPNCATELVREGGRLRCEEGHEFDVSRHGYVTLLAGTPAPGTADTAAMVAARARFLGEGHYGGIAALIGRLAGPALAAAPEGTCVLDLGAGTGYYLASVLAAADSASSAGPPPAGIALDISKHAARHAVRAHPRIGAVVADAWRDLPVRGQAAAVLLNVFAPRNPLQMRRVLHRDGRAVVVVPEPDHLRELIERFGLLTVDGRKRDRIGAQFAGLLAVEAEETYRETLRLTPAQVAAVVGMGPNAWHAAAAGLGSGASGPGSGSGSASDSAALDVTLAVRAYLLRRA